MQSQQNVVVPPSHVLINRWDCIPAWLNHTAQCAALIDALQGLHLTGFGLDGEQFRAVRAYALITAHEVLVVYCCEEPKIEKKSV